MAIDLKSMKERAKGLLNKAEPFVTRPTAGYDSAKNRVIVAGYTLDGVVTSSLSADTILKQEVGIDYRYTALYEVITQRTLTVTILPTARCLDVLRILALKQLENKGWFNISIHENNNIVNVYRGWIIELPEIGMQQEAGDRQVIFGVKTMFTSMSVIDQPTDTESETFSKYGINPSKAGADDSRLVVSENGKVFTLEDDYDENYDINSKYPPIIDGNINITPIKDS